MPETYEPIASAVATGSVFSFSFTSIPSTYTDLVLRYSVRSDQNGPYNQARIYLNGASGIYSATNIAGDGTNASSGRYANMPGGMELAFITPANAASGIYAMSEFNVMSYANTNTFKTLLVKQSWDGVFPRYSVVLARTTAAITSISVEAAGSSFRFVAGSTAALYGIKAA